MSNQNREIGDRIRTLRESKKGLNGRKMTQKELGRLIGIEDTHVSKWETGKHRPERSHLVKLANVLGVTVEYIVQGKEQISYVDEPTVDYIANQTSALRNTLSTRNKQDLSDDDIINMLEVAESMIRSAKELLKKG